MVTNAPTRRFNEAQLNSMARLTEALPSKAAKMRALEAAGFTRGDIAAFVGVSYQHVRNVLGPKAAKPVTRNLANDALIPDQTRRWGAVKVSGDGQLRLPPQALKALGVTKSLSLGWQLDGDVLILMGEDAGLKFVQELAANFNADNEEFLSDQVIKERRAENAIEEVKDELMHG